MKPLYCLFVGALLVSTAPAAQAAFVYNNMGQAAIPGLDIDPLSADQPLGASFSTSNSGVLSEIHVLLNKAAGTDGTFMVTVVADLPGPDLGNPLWSSGQLLDSSFVDNTSNGYWDLGLTTSPIALAANTRYWVILNGDPDSLLQWVWTLDTTGVGVANENWYSAGGTGPNSTGPFVMSVEVAAVPEPLSLGLFGLGLVGIGALRLRARTRASRS